jgi:hypothetical protein
MVQNPAANDDTEAAATLPRFSERNGSLVLEHGMHQEIGWQRSTDRSSMAVFVYSDRVENPVLEAMSRLTAQGPVPALRDSTSGLIRTAGPTFTSAGMEASVEHSFLGATRVSLSYRNGGALVMPALAGPVAFKEVLAAARPRRMQSYAISLSGTLEGTHTRWRASYRWQADDSVTDVAPFDLDASEPYLSVHFRQAIHVTRDGSGGVEALLDVRNLLAEGYRPYVLSDGSLLIFAQSQRALRGGLAFTF